MDSTKRDEFLEALEGKASRCIAKGCCYILNETEKADFIEFLADADHQEDFKKAVRQRSLDFGFKGNSLIIFARGMIADPDKRGY